MLYYGLAGRRTLVSKGKLAEVVLVIPIVIQNTATAQASQSFDVKCRKSIVSSTNVTCSDTNFVMPIYCTGKAGIVTKTCPRKYLVSQCASLDSSKRSECKMISFSDTNITCACTLQADTDLASVDIGSMLTVVAEGVTSTWSSASELNANTVSDNWLVLTSIGGLGALFFVAVIIAHKKDAHSLRVSSEEDAKKMKTLNSKVAKVAPFRLSVHSESVRPETFARVTETGTLKSDEEEELDVATIVEQALPQTFGSLSFSARFIVELKRFHRWLGIIFHYNPELPRAYRVAVLSTHVITVLFLQAMTYELTHTDDGSCKMFTSQQQCLEKASAYNSQQSKCLWNIDVEYNQSPCVFREANSSMFPILYIATICCIISTPINLMCDWIVMKVLLARTLHSRPQRVSPDSSDALTAKRSTQHPNLSSASSLVLSRRAAVNQLSSVQAWDLVAKISGKEKDEDRIILGTTLETDLSKLVEDIKRHRHVLPVSERTNFDECWGLTSSGEFQSANPSSSVLTSYLRRICCMNELNKSDTLSALRADLESVRESIFNEMVNMIFTKTI